MSTKHSSIVPSLFVLLSVWVAGCADAGYSSLSEERVQVQLCARDGVLSRASDASNLPEQEFEATVALSTAKGDYASLSEACEGTWNATVKTDGKMEWKTAGGSDVPVYPSSGDWLYLTAFSPTAVPSGGVASFVLTGQTDLLYAPELQGNKWEGERFAGNQWKPDRPLQFSHLLTQLSFKARKAIADGVEVQITKIKVNEAKPCVSLPLSTGIPTFTATTEHPVGLTLDVSSDGGKKVTGTTPVEVGKIQVPPLEGGSTYTLKVETSIGTFDNVSLTFGDSNASGKNPLQAGMSHVVTLNIGDHELGITSVTVQAWASVTVDGTLDAD